MNEEFTYDDIQVGDFIKQERDDIFEMSVVLFKDIENKGLILYHNFNSMSEYYFTDDLKSSKKDSEKNDIIKIRRPLTRKDYDTFAFEWKLGELLFERED